MREPETKPDANGPDANGAAATDLALRALVWTLAEPDRAIRLLDTTGLTPADLRARASDPAVLGALLDFLAAHEPDLVACAAGLGVTPTTLVAARGALEDAR